MAPVIAKALTSAIPVAFMVRKIVGDWLKSQKKKK
jgi:hypothetical protein